jgi:hypothetical protein
LAFSISAGRPGIEGIGKAGEVSIGVVCVIAVASVGGGTAVSGAFVAATWLHRTERSARHPIRIFRSEFIFILYNVYYITSG